MKGREDSGVRRVTDFRVDRVQLAEADYWRLPERTRELIRVYGSPVVSTPGVLSFELAIDRWEEIERSLESAKALQADPVEPTKDSR